MCRVVSDKQEEPSDVTDLSSWRHRPEPRTGAHAEDGGGRGRRRRGNLHLQGKHTLIDGLMASQSKKSHTLFISSAPFTNT